MRSLPFSVEGYQKNGILSSANSTVSEDAQKNTPLVSIVYSHLLNNIKMPICLKRKIMNGVILPAMIDGSDTWSLTKKKRERLAVAVAQRNMEILMLGITRKDKKRNELIREKQGR